jgi:hypothetical protein
MTTAHTESGTHTETIEVKGTNLTDRVTQLIHEGNVRRITAPTRGRSSFRSLSRLG